MARIDSAATDKNKRAPHGFSCGARRAKSGGVLLSQGVNPQVPSALTGLTSVFGMGTGVTLSLWPPKSVVKGCASVRRRAAPQALQSKHERSIQALGRLVPVG